MNLRCYCCGDAIEASISLVAYQDNVDRVFVFKPEHVERVDEAAHQMLVVPDDRPRNQTDGSVETL